ncbi:membrane-bound alpha-1,6- mannosyltransferase Initiation-specific [Myotisia sp. PD_48]|nr:membrane-bound alpha-1,6- mannosyltransferase Initiation-specific [Myotisia sp. PD_48]
MISFRRCVLIAFFLLSCLYLLRTSHQEIQNVPLQNNKPESNSSPSSTPTTNPLQQKLSEDELARKPLRERLRYQFPYHLESKLPAYIWQTWKHTPASGRFSEKLRPLEASWTEAHPGFVHQVLDNNGALYLLKYLYAAFPEILDAYQSMPLPVLRADFFRYLVLLARGGIYTDIDTYAIKSATEWLPDSFDRSTIGLIIGIEADPNREDWAKWYSRRIQFCQWTIQAKPGHPVLRDVVSVITEEALRMKNMNILSKSKMDRSIVEFTGPAVWTDAIFRYFNNPLYFDVKDSNISFTEFTGMTKQKKLGDVAILPITSFSPGVGQMGAEEPEHEMAFVKHEFSGMSNNITLRQLFAANISIGSWKPPAERAIGH